jgi:broad specificity phosphatase PhoE
MSSVIFVRHGESLGNMDESHYLLPDVANILSPHGVKQCMDLAKVFKNHLNDDFYGVHTTVFASRFQRAYLTAQIVTSEMRVPITIDNRLNEVYHCARKQPAESREHILARVRALVEQNHFNLILFTHGMLMREIDPSRGNVANAEVRKYDRKDLLDNYLK